MDMAQLDQARQILEDALASGRLQPADAEAARTYIRLTREFVREQKKLLTRQEGILLAQDRLLDAGQPGAEPAPSANVYEARFAALQGELRQAVADGDIPYLLAERIGGEIEDLFREFGVHLAKLMALLQEGGQTHARLSEHNRQLKEHFRTTGQTLPPDLTGDLS